MSEQTTFLLMIERLAYGGEGVGRYEGKTVFVPFAAPGDLLLVEIVEERPRFARARIVEIKTPGPGRVAAPCSVFGRCGGCQWQHLGYETQAEQKEALFSETLVRLGKIAKPPTEPIILAEKIWEYRERIRVKVNQAGAVGFYSEKSHEVVPFEYCNVSAPALNEYIQGGARLKNDCELALDPATRRVHVHLDQKDYRHFRQAHPEQNIKLVALVKDYLGLQLSDDVLELYSGAGNFSLSLAHGVASWVGVDLSDRALAIAREAARQRQLVHLKFQRGSATWALKSYLRQGHQPHVLLLDPPRAGAKDILDLLTLLNPPKIVYVSCDPTTLARDLQFLLKKGYTLKRTRPIDMFPQTYHMESVSLLVHQ